MAGETAGGEKVSFTKASAQRIADAVRAVEQGNRDGVPFISAPRGLGGGGGGGVKICTFAGAWPINGIKTVNAKFPKGTTGVQQFSATNLFADISGCDGPRNCAIAKEGTAWFLIAAQCQ